MDALPNPPASFDMLRPYCVQLTMEQTVLNVKRLRSQISVTNVCVLQSLADYALFPLHYSLSSEAAKDPHFLQALLDCIAYVLSLIRMNTKHVLLDLFSKLCQCLPPDPLKGLSEELKLSHASALRSLIRAASSHTLPVLYEPCMLAELGLTINKLLKLSELEKSREVRLGALNCLHALVVQDLKLTFPLGDLFVPYFPGICTALARIVCGDPKQGYRLTCTALHIWAGVVHMVLSDDSLSEASEDIPKFPMLPKSMRDLLVPRDSKWVETTTTHLCGHLAKIAEHCKDDPHWKVRLELVNTGYMLIARCWKTLTVASGTLLKILVGHLNDERPEVKMRAMDALQEVTNGGPASQSLGEVLSENLHSLAVTLPRLLSSQDDHGKVHTLALLTGYLQLLGPRLRFTLCSSAHLQRLSTALLQMLEMDFGAMKVVEEQTTTYSFPLKQFLASADTPPKTFRFFRDKRVLFYIWSVCRHLGYFGELRLLVDHFLVMYRAKRLPAVLVLNQLVQGAAGVEVHVMDGGINTLKAEELLEAVRPILDEYMDPSNWYLQTSSCCHELEDQMSLLQMEDTANDRITYAWKISLQLEGIAYFAKAIGRSFHSLLITVLYPLLEKAGDGTPMISAAANTALLNVSDACGCKDVSQLVELNSDYLASEISVGLRRLGKLQGGAACVLRFILENCGPNILPLLEDLVQDLLPALDQSPDEVAKTLLPVLKSLIVYIGKWLGPDNSEMTANVAVPQKRSSEYSGNLAREMEEFFKTHMEQQRLARGDVHEEECADVLPPEMPTVDEEQIEPVFTHIKISKEVAEKCMHFLSHSDPHIRIQALDVLRLCIVQLQSQENILLPLAHKMWPCLVKRLLHEDPVILQRAYQVLVCLTATCKDFLRQRVCKEALPAFLNFLRTQAASSSRAVAVYSHSQAFKLQLAMLEGLGDLCVSLGLGDGDLMEVADSFMFYLSTHQPKKLQAAARCAFFTLAELDPDMIWLYLCKWQRPPGAEDVTVTKSVARLRCHWTASLRECCVDRNTE
uniref:TELO2 interacting protein 1 n=1 Tax=Leptobrachium leishanense TaxID=445787 RepID=A0A8C5QDE7_9ANUR